MCLLHIIIKSGINYLKNNNRAACVHSMWAFLTYFNAFTWKFDRKIFFYHFLHIIWHQCL